ncbi:2-dehydropantoate 2-reductase [Orrella sp. NBD-18]|uniref:2-dehydropantoate 2-reductase n=1 Tax=Sheuella amnicola TaxID=2707330 RepID=A0A6B2R3B5_9BURK|nr:2-dehydropantoate 2-reductase [Sheuella amnicola]NDY81925.1 2-dehydropantoate 2-reductase [Sheuella amnicola]
MRLCIFGTGAVGGHLAARFISAAKDEVSVIARGAQLQAIRTNGITLQYGDTVFTGHPAHATDDPDELTPQDVIIVTLKAQAIPTVVESIEKLLSPTGVVIFAINGIPWWWNFGLPVDQKPLPLLDPDASLWTRLRKRTLGCVIYSPNEVTRPGVVLGAPGDRWMIGEPDGSETQRLSDVIALFERANIKGIATCDIRKEVWKKLVINAGLNPLAALTRLPTAQMTSNESVRQQMKDVMREVLEIAAASGTDLRDTTDLDEMVAPKKRPGSLRASMLQDVLAGRSLEIEAIIGQVVEFAHELKVPAPKCELLLGLTRGLDQSLHAV